MTMCYTYENQVYNEPITTTLYESNIYLFRGVYSYNFLRINVLINFQKPPKQFKQFPT